MEKPLDADDEIITANPRWLGPSGIHLRAAFVCQGFDLHDDGTFDVLGITNGLDISPEDSGGERPVLLEFDVIVMLASLQSNEFVRGGGIHRVEVVVLSPQSGHGAAVTRDISTYYSQVMEHTLVIPFKIPVYYSGVARIIVRVDNTLKGEVPFVIRLNDGTVPPTMVMRYE